MPQAVVSGWNGLQTPSRAVSVQLSSILARGPLSAGVIHGLLRRWFVFC